MLFILIAFPLISLLISLLEFSNFEIITKSIINKNLSIVDLIILSKLETSKSEIRRLIKGNAIKINNQNISSDKFIIQQILFNDSYLKLSIGKKRHIKIELI